jgi:hypothetical protein
MRQRKLIIPDANTNPIILPTILPESFTEMPEVLKTEPLTQPIPKEFNGTDRQGHHTTRIHKAGFFAKEHKRGRPKGCVSQETRDIRMFARLWTVGDPRWVRSARARMRKGTAPHLEKYLLEMGYGKPRETVEIATSDATVFRVLQGLLEARGNAAQGLLSQGDAVDAVPVESTTYDSFKNPAELSSSAENPTSCVDSNT